MKIKTYYVEHTISSEYVTFKSLKKAVEYSIQKKNEMLIIHVGGWNLDGYNRGDTFETLYNRCKKYLAEIK